MVIRRVSRKVVAVETAEGAGATVKRLFPTRNIMHFDPFVLLDEFFVKSPAGFPSHPHGGFEAITYLLEGGFHHVDNIGNDSIVLAGGLQKFTAGKGIVHSEMPGTKGMNRGLQLWIRLPTRLHDLDPDYQQVEPRDVPEKDADGIHVRVVAGGESAVKLHTAITYLDVTLLPTHRFAYDADPKANMFLYVLEGVLSVDNSKIHEGEVGLLTLGERVEATAEEKARFVLVGGRPHGEPIILRGSYVY